jgi:hypothetical protein
LLNERWKWGNGYTVPSTTLEAFCTEHNVSPDFIHIDVQGAEHKVFSAIGNIRPSIVWAEISEFNMYDTGTTYDDFRTLLESLGYSEKFKDSWDALYTLNGINVKEYESKQIKLEHAGKLPMRSLELEPLKQALLALAIFYFHQAQISMLPRKLVNRQRA